MKIGDLVRVYKRDVLRDDPNIGDDPNFSDCYGIFLGMAGHRWVYDTVPPSPNAGKADPDFWNIEVVNENW